MLSQAFLCYLKHIWGYVNEIQHFAFMPLKRITLDEIIVFEDDDSLTLPYMFHCIKDLLINRAMSFEMLQKFPDTCIFLFSF